MALTDYREKLAKELTDAYFALRGRHHRACDLMRLAAEQPCSRFWVSAQSAQRAIAQIRQHGKECLKNELFREMIVEIMHRCHGDFSIDNITLVVLSDAPKFYLRPETARRIIQRELKNRRLCARGKTKPRLPK